MSLVGQRPITRRPVSTGVALGALVAIPVASVSSVALLFDVASSADPSRVLVGIAGLALGLASGALSRRGLRSLRRQAQSVTLGVLALIGRLTSTVTVRGASPTWSPRRHHAAAALIFVPSDVGRRGPPRQLR